MTDSRQQTADSRYRNHEPQFRVQITQVLKESRKEQKAAANTSISHTKIRTSLAKGRVVGRVVVQVRVVSSRKVVKSLSGVGLVHKSNLTRYSCPLQVAAKRLVASLALVLFPLE